MDNITKSQLLDAVTRLTIRNAARLGRLDEIRDETERLNREVIEDQLQLDNIGYAAARMGVVLPTVPAPRAKG